MEHRPFGPTGVEVPVIGQGTWQVRDHDAAERALRKGLLLGMTHIDTAEMYTGSEQTVRRAVEGHDRDDLFVVSKVLPKNASHEGTRSACKASLDRLGMAVLDVYLLHWWSDAHPIEDTMRAMAELVDEGRIRWAGVSNLDVEEMEAARDALGEHPLVCNQVPYHLRDRGIEEDVLPYCAEEGIAVVAYSPYGKSRGGFPEPKSKQWEVLKAVGDRHDRTPRQVALRWITRHDHVFTIPKSEDVAHVEENAGGQGFSLDDSDLELIDGAFPLR